MITCCVLRTQQKVINHFVTNHAYNTSPAEYSSILENIAAAEVSFTWYQRKRAYLSKLGWYYAQTILICGCRGGLLLCTISTETHIFLAAGMTLCANHYALWHVTAKASSSAQHRQKRVCLSTFQGSYVWLTARSNIFCLHDLTTTNITTDHVVSSSFISGINASPRCNMEMEPHLNTHCGASRTEELRIMVRCYRTCTLP